MKIYVAGRWTRRDEVRQIMRILEEQGHTITLDWTHQSDLSKGGEYALKDLQGVRECDTFVGLFDADERYEGAFIELGGALILQKDCHLIGHNVQRIYGDICTVHKNLGDFFQVSKGWAK